MPSTRCKFYVTDIGTRLGTKKVVDEAGKEKWIPAPVFTVKLAPVYGNNDPNHENTKFWNASPCGSFELGTINEGAAAIFELGREYYIDISAA